MSEKWNFGTETRKEAKCTKRIRTTDLDYLEVCASYHSCSVVLYADDISSIAIAHGQSLLQACDFVSVNSSG